MTSLAYGIEAYDEESKTDTLSVIVPRNSPYNIAKSQTYKTIVDNQTKIKIKVLQGKEDNISASKCLELGTLWIHGIKKDKA